MKKLLLLSFLFATAVATAQTSVTGFEYIGRIANHRYYLQKDAVPGSAIDAAVQLFKTRSGITKAYAAVLNYAAENDSVTRMVQRCNNNHFVQPYAPHNAWSDLRNVWIGLSDRVTEGTWKWLNGDASTYRNWNAGEPNNVAPVADGEDYVQLLLMEAYFGKWNDWGATPLPVLIETESNQTLAVQTLSLRAVKGIDGIALFPSAAGTIERSTDGRLYYTISRTAGTMVDRTPEADNYYRLRTGSQTSAIVYVRYNPTVYQVYNHLGQLVARTSNIAAYRAAGYGITR